MKLRMETGHPVTADVKRVHGDTVRFVTDDGRTMFEVRARSDGCSIEVRGVEVTKVAGVLHNNTLTVAPMASNSIVIGTALYEGQS